MRTQPDVSDPNILWNDWKAKFLAVADTHAPSHQGELEANMHHGLQLR